MNELTKRQVIALEMLKQHATLITTDHENQTILIQDALDFADYFIDISEDKMEDTDSIS